MPLSKGFCGSVKEICAFPPPKRVLKTFSKLI